MNLPLKNAESRASVQPIVRRPMEYKFFECDECGNELRLSFDLSGATAEKSETGRPVQEQLGEMQSRVEMFEVEVRSVLGELDHLAEVWGDEGVFRRCRDRLRKVLDQAAS